MAFKNGVRAIMIDIEDQRFNEFATRRKYVASPVEDLPPWFEGAWAFCKPPTEEEWEELNRLNSNLDMQGGMRLEALCKIEVDYESFTTSVIFSVPDL
ncbi:hypothetical protein SAMN04488239_12057 [Ruegeria marina]|uniref:Uncharacterized protein n=1 Tax=Ruegeria marina TaxID=639004 RepID=A0A1G7D8W0_9RHOB|nr:hypothetical protein SAMN04488239_12057 [Ruegeria marina]